LGDVHHSDSERLREQAQRRRGARGARVLDKQTIFDRAETLYPTRSTWKRESTSFVYDTFPNDPLGTRRRCRRRHPLRQVDPTSLTEARLRYRDFANRYPNDPTATTPC
jgi:hypothetical protein